MNPSILCRPAVAADHQHLDQIYNACRRQTFSWAVSPDDYCSLATDSQGETIISICSNDQLIGFAAIWVPDNFLHHLYIAPASQAQGAGSAALQ